MRANTETGATAGLLSSASLSPRKGVRNLFVALGSPSTSQPLVFRPSSIKKVPDTFSQRRGISMLVVLLLLSIALSVSYAVMRSQATMVAIEQNADQLANARNAARTGLQVALALMHRSDDWAGVGSALHGNVSATETYSVTFTTGDPSLSESDPDWDDYPYRVTIESTGYALLPSQSAVPATHKIRAVVQLVPTDMPDEPADWALLQQYTVFQEDDSKDFLVELPCRIEGPVRAQGELIIAKDAPDKDDARDKYLTDLEALRQDGHGDYRPLDGPVELPASGNSTGIARLGQLGVTADTGITVTSLSSDWIQPTGLTTYRLYPGGESYSVSTVGSSLDDTTLEPDPLTNPLGIFYHDGSLTIGNDVTVRGSLFCKNDLTIDGTNVQFLPVELPSIYGTVEPVRLPVATCHQLRIEDEAGGSISGFVAAFDTFEFKKGTQDMSFAITGRVVTSNDFLIQVRDEWDSTNWSFLYNLYNATTFSPGSLSVYFPVYCATWNRNLTPCLTISADASPVTYHWQKPDADQAVFEPRTSDTGLHWDVLEYTENP